MEPDSLSFLALTTKLQSHSALGGHAAFCKIPLLVLLYALLRSLGCIENVQDKRLGPGYLVFTVIKLGF